MSDYLNEIDAFIPDMNVHAKRKQAERDRAAADEAERARQEMLKTQRLAEMEQASRDLGVLVVRHLIDQSVPDVSVISKRKTGFVHEVGRGWHVVTRTFREYGSKRTERIGVDEDGAVVTFDSTTTKDNDDKEWTGIVGANRISDPEKRHAIVTSDYFKRGVALLIASGGPYEFVQSDKPVDDPSEPPLPGM